jgi:hypothetical protein
MRVPAAQPGAGAKTRLTEEGRGAVQVGNACPSCRTGGWREDPAEQENSHWLSSVFRLARSRSPKPQGSFV